MASLLSFLPAQTTPLKVNTSIQKLIPIPPSFSKLLPSGFGDTSSVGKSSANIENNFKVRLISVLDMAQGYPKDSTQVIFEVTPTLSESRSVDYTPVQPVHMPGGIQVYKFTGSRTFELSAHFISRNVSDAYKNIKNLQTLRSWTLPFFGSSSTDFTGNRNISATPSPYAQATPDQQMSMGQDKIKQSGTAGVNLLGAPPEVLYLYGYSASQSSDRLDINGININRIPVVLTSLNFSYPEDVDYIPVEITPGKKTEPFPVKMDVTISLTETHSPVEYERFDLLSYKSGSLKNF